MAKLPSDIRARISHLREQLLDIIDNSKSAEFILLERFGETPETFATLEQLAGIAEQATSRLSQVSTLQLRIAESQPLVAPDLLRLMHKTIAAVENRVPALQRSIEEIRLDWRLA